MKKTPHMIAQEQRILEILAGNKLGHTEVAKAMGLSRSGAAKYMTRMHSQRPKMIHIGGHMYPETGGQPRPFFSAGDFPDAVYEPLIVKKPKRETSRGDEKRARILEALAIPMTGHEIAAAVFLSQEQAMKYVKDLREATPRKVFIKKWRHAPGQGQWAPLYMAGDKPDAKHPGKETRAARYKKERANMEYVDRFNRKRRHTTLIDSFKKQPASWAAALGI